MKKLSIIVLLSIIALPGFAANDLSDAPKSDVATEQKLTDAEKIKLKQEFKDEIKSELKQEYADSKHSEKIAFPHGVQIGAGISATGGLNGFIGYANKEFDSFWAKRFGVRFDFATTKPIKYLIDDGIDAVMGDDGIDIGDNLTITDGKLDASHFAALVDFYPFGDSWLLGGWRITGGYAFGDMDMSANIAGTFDGPSDRYEFELSGQKYAYTGNSVHGTADLDWKYRGPYLGTGFDIGLFAGLKIYVDAGVVFTNKSAQLSLDIPTDNLQQYNGTTWESVDIPELNAVIDETLSDAQSELDDLKFYPMVKLGFMYRF